jgi:hypothetical protein
VSLNFKEKRGLQKTVSEQQTALRSGLGFAAKRAAQKAMGAAMTRLTGSSVPVPENPYVTTLREILAGARYNLDLQSLLNSIGTAVEGLHAAGELLGEIENLADQAITHWANLEAAEA